jgi:EmrB/QacA subfamily drug resistance transporter
MMAQQQSVQDQDLVANRSSSSSQDEREGDAQAISEPTYPPTSKVLVIMAGLFLTTFLVALDRLIVGVAVPRITDDFHSLGDVGWYGSAYLLTTCAFTLFMGRVYTFYSPKWVYLSSILVFEIGSTVCGAAPTSTALIIGRAVAGLGNAGLFQGNLTIIVHILPLHKRPQYTGFFGMVLGVASAAGPLLGGAFTDGPGWRWCFYINLPCGGVVVVLLLFFLHIPQGNLQRKPTTFKDVATRLDLVGTFFLLPCIICLLLALQWGGLTYSWGNARIIALLVLSGILFIIFLIVQRWKGENATVPGHIFFNRSIVAGVWFSFCIGGALQTVIYFLPVWFQAIKGASAIKSGIMNLPMVIGLAITSVLAGILTKKIGYYVPWMILSSILTAIGAGLISTFTPHTAHSAWIGYQALFGLGLGLGLQQALVAAQTVLARKDVPTGASLMMVSQNLGGAVFISVGNNLLDSQLAKGLAPIPGINIDAVTKIGATDLRAMIPSSKLSQVLVAYNAALRATFYLVTALACVTIFGSLAMKWTSIKVAQKKPPNGASADADPGKNIEKPREQG